MTKQTLSEAKQWLENGLDRADSTDGKYIRTPWQLCDEIIRQVKATVDFTDKKFLVVDTIEFVSVLLTFDVKPCNITYVAPYAFKGRMALSRGVTVVQESLLTWKTNMKFDVVVGNPPYSGDLHLKFLEKCMSSLVKDYLIFVHPSAWIVKSGIKSQLELTCVNFLKTYESRLMFIKGFYYFGVAQYTPCTITFINKTKKRISQSMQIYDESKDCTWNFKSIDQINIISDSDEFAPLVAHIKTISTKSIADLVGRDGLFFVEIPKIRGSAASKKTKLTINHKDFYTSVPKACKVYRSKPTGNYVGFNTELEALNFISYMKTTFSRFCLALLKFDQNIQKSKLRHMPIVDFTKAWDDDLLFTEFKITDNWAEIIKSAVPVYYN